MAEQRITPRNMKPVLFANIGVGEEFMRMFVEELPDILAGTTIPNKEGAKHAISVVRTDGLMRAFNHLKRIRASATEPMPELDRMQLYEDFTRVLWHSYKDLMPRAVENLGSDVGFMFQNEGDFEKGLARFKQHHPRLPPGFDEHLRNQRTDWQSGLAEFRNQFLEHREQGPDKFRAFYQPQVSEHLFDSVWRTIMDILIVLMSMKAFPGFELAENPEARRTAKNPRRFCYVRAGSA